MTKLNLKLNFINLRIMLIGIISLAMFLILASPTFAASVTLNEPPQDCINSNRRVNLSWTSDISGNPTYYILRKLVSEINYSEISNTGVLVYTDNTALSDKSYSYQIKAEKGASIYFSNEITALENYCPAVFSATQASCKTDGPHNSLAWSVATGDVSGYEILRRNETLGEAEFTKIGETTGYNYDDGPNIIGTNSYFYAIRTVWEDGTEGDSAPVSIDAMACPVILNTNTSCNSGAPGGQKVNLSWNGLMGVFRYEIYRKAQSDADYSLLSSINPSLTAYSDNLVESMSLTYWQSGNINYFIKTVWLKDTDEISKDSASKQIANFHCAPFVGASGMCDASGNPEMRLNWTKTMNSDFYNLFRNDITFLGQYSSGTSSFTDYLSPADCPGAICTHNYKVISGVTGYPNFVSNTASQNVDCATIIPPSPDPVLNVPEIFCDNGDSKIKLSWTPSENVIYYTLYRNGASFLNLTNTTYIDSGVEGGSEYAYYVIANGREGTQTAPSLAQTVNASNCIPPASPNLSLFGSCVLGNPKINLSWSFISNTINYEIKRGLSESEIATKAIINNSTYSWSDTDSLNASTAYYYQLVANGVLGVSPGYSAVKSITTDSCLPTLPVINLNNFCTGGNPKVTVNWISDNVNTQNYKVFREDIALPIATVPAGGAYSVDDPNPLSVSTTYKYKVVAIGYNVGQETSSVYTPITAGNCLPPGPFTLADPPSASCQGAYPKVQLNWTSSENATSYSLFRSAPSSATFNNVASPYNEVGYGYALNFDGSNDYVKVVGLGVNASAGSKNTVEFWMKWSGQNSVMPFGWNTNYDLWFNGGCFGFNTGEGNILGFSSSGLANKLVHVAAEFYNGVPSAANNKIYIDGVQKTLTNCLGSTTGYRSATSNAYISGWGSDNGYRFNGMIDDVRIYKRTLSSAETLEHYNGIYSDETGLVGLWHFDEGTGQTVSDSSDYGKNTTLGSTAGADSNDPVWINDIQSETNYSWEAEANNIINSVSSNTTAPFLTPDCPPQKSNLTFIPQCIANKSVIGLSWPYSINASSYEIYRDGIWVKTIGQSADPANRKWNDDNSGIGLNDSTDYTYYIKSISSGGANSQSANRSATTLFCAVPLAPTGLSATFSCTGTPASTPKITLSWNAVSNATSYDIYRNGIFLINKTVLAHDDTTINVNTLYDYTVRAKNAGGTSSDSNTASIGLGNYCTPQKPAITLSAGCSGGNPSNTITWTGETYPNTQIYKIYRGTVNNFADAGTNLIRTIDKTTELAVFNARTYIDNPSAPRLGDETNYYYWVEAIGPAPASYFTLSDSKMITTLFCTVPISTDGLSATFSCSGTPPSNPYASLSWTAVTNATSYDIYKNGIFLINRTVLTYDDTGISVNTAYGYTVRAKNAGGAGSDSNTASIGLGNYCTPSLPTINPITSVCDGNESKNTISWTDATSLNTANFEIYRSSNSTSISDFESVTFPPPGWITGGNANWFRDTAASGEGAASAASGAIGHNQSTYFDYDITVSDPSVLRFFWKVSSENNYDFLLFCLDNDGCTRTSGYRNRISGTSMTSFAEVVAPISAGAHSFRWVYAKDGGAVSGSDRGWIDNVQIVSIDSATLLQTVDKNTLSWIDSGSLAPLADYIYWIKAVGPTGLSSFSARSVKTLSCEIMPPAASLNASFLCAGSSPYAALGWDSVPNATSYNIYRDGSYLTSRTTNSYNDLGIAVNTAYSYFVRADNDAGEGPDSNVASIGLGNYCTPSVPVISSLTTTCASGNSKNTINWSDATVFNTQKYEIYRGTADDFSLATLARPPIDKVADSAIFTSRIWPDDSGLSFATRYYYWVKGIGPTGYSSVPSSSASVITYNCTPPIAPGVSVIDICSSYNKPITLLNWNKTSNTDSYNLYKNAVLNKTVTLDNSGYIRNWLLIGGFSYTGDLTVALNTDYLGGELIVKPRAGESVGGKTWFEYNTTNNYIDFTLTSSPMSSLSPKTFASAYAFAYVYSPIAQTAQLRIGSDDGVKAFLNGSLIYTNNTQRGASPDQDIRAINLLAGMNNLLIKVQQGAGGWGLYARITDASGNSILNDVTAWDSAAIEGVSENYYVSSIGPGGTSDPSSNIVASNSPNCLPKQPDITLIPGCDLSGTQIVLLWDPDPNTSYWTIYKKRTSQPDTEYICINCPGTTLNSYTDLNVESNASYDYYVEAHGSGSSAISEVKTALAPVCFDIPNKPVINRDSGYVCGGVPIINTDNTVFPKCAGSASRMEINWDPYDDSNTFSYNIFRKNITAGETDFTMIKNLPFMARNYIDDNINNAETYIYKIEAVGSGVGNSVESEPSLQITSCDCLNIPPFYPPFLFLVSASYTLSSGGNVEIKWNDAQNETSYEILRRLQGDSDMSPIGVLVAGVDYQDPSVTGYVKFNDLTAEEDMTYEYQVGALNAAGTTNSNIISPVYVPIAPPGDFTLSYENLPGKVKLNWSASAYSEKGGPPVYTVYKDISSGFSSPEIICENVQDFPVNQNNRECIDNDISSGLAYYKVRAINDSPAYTESNIVLVASSFRWDETAP